MKNHSLMSEKSMTNWNTTLNKRCWISSLDKHNVDYIAKKREKRKHHGQACFRYQDIRTDKQRIYQTRELSKLNVLKIHSKITIHMMKNHSLMNNKSMTNLNTILDKRSWISSHDKHNVDYIAKKREKRKHHGQACFRFQDIEQMSNELIKQVNTQK